MTEEPETGTYEPVITKPEANKEHSDDNADRDD